MTTTTRRERIQARASALGGRTRLQTAHAAAGDDTSGAGGTPSSAELWLYGVVGGYWYGFSSESVADALRGLDVDQITVRLHSPGGNAVDGIAIGNLLRNHKARVTVVIDGLAASAASIVALAGDEIVMSPGSQYMIHDPWMLTVGNAAELRSDADFLDKQADNYAGVYAHRATGKTAAQWREVMVADDGRGTWFTAAEAVEAGLADRVGTVTATTPPPPDPAEDSDVDDDEMAARAAWDLDVLVHPAARAAWSSAERTPKPPSASAVGSHHTEGGSAVAFSDEQLTTMRQTLGLAENADEATIVAALGEALEERAEPTAAATTAVPEGMSLVETAVLDDLRTGAAAGRSAREQLDHQARDAAIDAAIADGRTTPARREHWVASWTADADGTRDMLAALAPGLAVPTSESGHSGEPEAGIGHLNIDDAELTAFAAQLGLSKEDLRG